MPRRWYANSELGGQHQRRHVQFAGLGTFEKAVNVVSGTCPYLGQVLAKDASTAWLIIDIVGIVSCGRALPPAAVDVEYEAPQQHDRA